MASHIFAIRCFVCRSAAVSTGEWRHL